MIHDLCAGAAQAKLLAYLDDATWKLVQGGPVAVLLTDDPRSAATLGLASLYAESSIRTYSTQNSRLALLAANRFGALHQTFSHLDSIRHEADKHGLLLLTGVVDGPGPFADPRVRDLLDGQDNSDALLAVALRPLLGADLIGRVG